jgi:hypothetical protein
MLKFKTYIYGFIWGVFVTATLYYFHKDCDTDVCSFMRGYLIASDGLICIESYDGTSSRCQAASVFLEQIGCKE